LLSNALTQLFDPVSPVWTTPMPPVLELSEVDDVPPEPDVDVPVEVEGAELPQSVLLRPALMQLDDRVLPVWTTPMLPVLELSDVDVVPLEPEVVVPVEVVGWEPWQSVLLSPAPMQLLDAVLPVWTTTMLLVVESSEADVVPPELAGWEPWHSVLLRPALTQLFEPMLPVWMTPVLFELVLSEVDDVPPDPEAPVELACWEAWHSVLLRPALTQLFEPVLPVWRTPMLFELVISEVDDVPHDPEDPVELDGCQDWH
jgi:hypothetical protein